MRPAAPETNANGRDKSLKLLLWPLLARLYAHFRPARRQTT